MDAITSCLDAKKIKRTPMLCWVINELRKNNGYNKTQS
jgi:hypothetical protein